MKIKINETESYDVELGQEITLVELNGLVTRLTKIQKVFSDPLALPRKYKKKSEKSETPNRDYIQLEQPRILQKGKNQKITRTEALKAAKVFYLHDYKPIERREKMMQAVPGLNVDSIISGMRAFCKHKGITAADIGIRKFPRLTEKKHPELWR